MCRRGLVMVRLRAGIVVIALIACLAIGASAAAQQMHRIGLLMVGDPGAPNVGVQALVSSLREKGFSEGQNLTIEYRYAPTSAELPALAAELVRLKVDVLVAVATPGIDAARQATTTIPIVMPMSFDAVSAGFIASLARPGGNITGVTLMATDVVGKRVELLKEAIPDLTRIAIVLGPPTHVDQAFVAEAENAARRLGLSSQVARVNTVDEMESAFESIGKVAGRGAALVIEHPIFFLRSEKIADWAIRHRVPTIHGLKVLVGAGGLMSYGANGIELFRRSGTYVEKILRGAKPSDLPVEQPTEYELYINPKTARVLGVIFPASILARAETVD
jgi:putative tryptophan/tyrosine transport system substrate-binding protein